MDGVSGRPGTGSSGTQPPSSPAAYSGNYIAGLIFQSTGTVWLQGYWWYVPAGGDTGPAKCALWQLTSSTGSGAGMVVPGSTVTSGTLTAGQFNFITLSTPLLLTNDGTYYIAALGFATTIGFPDTQHQFGAAQPYASGITNGPITAPPGSGSVPQSPYSTAGADPGVTMPFTNDAYDLLWLDVQVTDTPPASPAYRLWPNRPYAVGDAANGGVSVDTDGYTMSVEFSLTQPMLLSRIWFYSAPAEFGGAAAVALPTRATLWNAGSQSAISDNASVSWKTPSGGAGSVAGGWLYCDFSGSAVTLFASTNYKASVWYAGGQTWRTVVDAYWGSGLGANGVTVGPLSAPNTGGATPGQDSWSGPNLAWAYPGTYSNPENDWVDVEVTPVPPVTPAQVVVYSMRTYP